MFGNLQILTHLCADITNKRFVILIGGQEVPDKMTG